MKKWLILLILIGGLITTLSLTKQITRLLPKAANQPADISVDAGKTIGSMPRPWPNLAQGGEESTGMMSQVVDKVKPLKPDYIRLDHIFDFYETVSKENGQLRFNWIKLDKEIAAILQTGAKPFISLSYLPESLNLNDWQEMTRATINHYSGKNEKNIADIYYEVYNEPDLFGGYKIYGEKNYLDMYRLAANGAGQTSNTQPFKFGGPATTGMYKNWMEALFNLVQKENLRLDFISWHRYSLSPAEFRNDVDKITNLISDYPGLIKAERIISEWGFDPEINPGYDSEFGASHALACIREMLNRVQKAFWFEIKDGKDPNNQPFWGRWGLLTHESTGLMTKPRYKMLLWLNELGPVRLALNGEGSFVKGISAKKNQALQIYLVNYDAAGKNWETVPVTVKNLTPGQYQITKEWFNGKIQTTTATITADAWTDNIILGPNQSARITLTLNN